MTEHYQSIRYLNPGNIHFFVNEVGQLCAKLEDGTVVEDVLAYRTFPVTDHSRFISIREGATLSKQHEIGIIRNLNDFPHDQRAMVKEELAKRYFLHIITKINSITVDLGYMHWDCETDKGPCEITIQRWNQRMVYEAPSGCRVITDVEDNRYEIPDLSQLDAASQGLFRRFIHWHTS